MKDLRHRRSFRLAAAILALAIVLVQNACERAEDDVSAAIESARITLESVHPGTASPAPESQRTGAYDRVISVLSSKAASASDESAIAVSLLLAEAHSGRGQIAAARARRAESELTAALSRSGSLLERYSEQRNYAIARASYDPASEIKDIDGQLAARAEELSQLRTQAEEIKGKIDDLVAKAGRWQESAGQMRSQESEIRRRALTADVHERAELAATANTFRRQAEGLEKEAALFLAQAARHEPDLREVEHIIARVNKQRESLGRAREQANSILQQRREEAQQADRLAERTGKELVESLQKTLAVFDDQIVAPLDSAIEEFESAQSRLGRARGAGDAARSIEGTVQHAIGGAQLSRAQSSLRIAHFLDRVGSLQNPPAGSAPVIRRASELREQAKASLASAAESYERARTAYESLRLKGPMQERIQRVTMQMAEVERTIKGEPPVEESPPGDAADEDPAAS